MENVVRELRHDFTAAISSDQNDVTLDPSIAKLSEKIFDPVGGRRQENRSAALFLGWRFGQPLCFK